MPDLSKFETIVSLRRRKLIGQYVNVGELKFQRRIFKRITENVLVPTMEREYLTKSGLTKTMNTILDLMFNKLSDSDFGNHFLADESCQMSELLLEADSCGVPLLIAAPACPDYLKGGYVLGESIGDYARSLVKNIPRVRKFFSEHGFEVAIELDVADGDAEDKFLEPLLGIPREEFLRRTRSTEDAIKREVEKQGIEGVEVSSLLKRTEQMGVDYRSRQNQLAEQILSSLLSRTDKALDTLIKIREEEFEQLGIKKRRRQEAAAYELAGYSLYGELIGPDGLILITSPMAAICVSALNFLKADSQQISPTLYLRERKERVTSLFLND